MQALHPFEQQLAHNWPTSHWQDVTVLVGVSGGPDSVALLSGLARLCQVERNSAGRLVVVHFNHRLRGEESDQDAEFVRRLCDRHELLCAVEAAGRPIQSGRGGLEAAARRQRYAFFRRVADQVGARYLATGHTADDQAETVLHRIIRGTGLRGLAGIPATRSLSELTTIVRPLLDVTRGEVQAYLNAIPQPVRGDSSNWSLKLTRNRLRHELLPHLAQRYNRNVAQALTRLARQARQAQELVAALVTPLSDQAVTELGSGRIQIDSRPLVDQPTFLVCQLLADLWSGQRWPLQAMSEQKWLELAALVQQPTGSQPPQTLPGGVVARRVGDLVMLRRTTRPEQQCADP